MNLGALKPISKIVMILTLAAFLAVGIFGISHAFGMEMDKEGKMGGCLFIQEASICNMNTLEHITAWQSMLTSLPNTVNLLILFLGLVLVSFLRLRFQPNAPDNLLFAWKRYSLDSNSQSIHNPLQELFSRGILHPKLY